MIKGHFTIKPWKPPKLKHNKQTKYGWTPHYPTNIHLGHHIDIGAGSHLWAHDDIMIGNCVQIGGLCLLYTWNSEDEIRGPIVIDDYAHIGAHSTIFPGVTIGRYAIVGAYSMVKQNIPPYALAYGIPAKVIKYE